MIRIGYMGLILQSKPREIMIQRIYHVVDKLCPLKDFKFAKERPKWISDDLIELMKNRDKALQQYKRTKSDEDKNKMRRMRNMVNVAVKAARNDYVKTQLDTHQKDPKKFWKNINEILPSKNDGTNLDNIFDKNRNRISHDKLPDAINTFFATIGKELDKQFDDNDRHGHQYPGIVRDEIIPLDSFEMITVDSLNDELKKIAIHKSSGIQNLSSYVMKMCFNILNVQLLVIFNKSLFQGYFPIGWRKATVVPIPKVPIPKEIGDLRPIALTPLPGKLLERFVHTQIMAHLDNNFLLNEIQNGFRKKHSTTDTIFKFTTELQHNKNNKFNTIALYIDFKKAFDTVNHNILLEKLKLLKIGKKVLLWVKTYLSDRTQVTQIQNLCSSREVVATGVPQGSILGPMLFLCYINDISSICGNTKMLLYADDTVMYRTISDGERYLDLHNFKQDIDKMFRWCRKNRLSINVKKTKLVFYPHSSAVTNDVNNEIFINRQPVQYVNSYLYLGIDIDEHLTFKKYFSTMIKNVSHKLYILRKVRPMLNIKASVDIVKTMICSIIDYGNMFIGSCNLQDLSDLQVLQNSALRCCYNISDPRDEHITVLHANANVQTVDVRRKRQQIVCIWRNIQNGFIVPHIPNRITRTAGGINIRLPIPRTELFKKSVYYVGSKLWNDLDENIRDIKDLDDFKKNIKAIYADC